MIILLKLLIIVVTFGAGVLIFNILVPTAQERYTKVQQQKVRDATRILDDMFVWVERKKLFLIFGLSPVALGIVFFILFGNLFLIVGGIAGGFFLPMIVIKHMHKARRKKFAQQITDAIVSLSQSLKAGLSFIQALEIITEELPPPISQEFAMILKENKMGITLEESFERLNKKMDIDDLNFMSTAILVAHETGGDLPKLLTNLSETIRQRRIIHDEVKTLTTQARWQGVIMSALPVVFAVFVFRMNPHFFDIMIDSEVGRIALIWCVISEIAGAIVLHKLSTVET